jgi:DNA-binding GntR family transcriptional regulator
MTTDLVRTAVAELRQVLATSRHEGKDRLPPEVELSRQLGVGRSTLREALALLETEGLIERKRRRGTTIRPIGKPWGPSSLAFPAHLILALSEYLAAAGIPYDIRGFEVRRETGTADVTEALALPAGADVYRVDRLYDINGTPGAHLRHYFPTELSGKQVQISSLRDGATTFLQEVEHVRLAATESIITTEPAEGTLARDLRVVDGRPLLVMYAKLLAEGIGVVAVGRIVLQPEMLVLSARAVEEVVPTIAS